MFLTWKNKINCQGKIAICQGIVREMSGNFEPTQMWQPCYTYGAAFRNLTEEYLNCRRSWEKGWQHDRPLKKSAITNVKWNGYTKLIFLDVSFSNIFQNFMVGTPPFNLLGLDLRMFRFVDCFQYWVIHNCPWIIEKSNWKN